MERKGDFIHLTEEESELLGYISPVHINLVDVFAAQDRIKISEEELLIRRTDENSGLHPEPARILREGLRLQRARQYLQELGGLISSTAFSELDVTDKSD